MTVDERFLDRVPHEFARRHRLLLPAGAEGRESAAAPLWVGSESSPFAIHNVGTLLGQAFTPVPQEDEDLVRRIDAAYEQRRHQSPDGSSREQSPEGDLNETPEAEGLPSVERTLEELLEHADRDLLATEGKSRLVQLVDALLFEAIGRRVSDVHIQPLEDRALVRFRVDGALYTHRELPRAVAPAVVSRIKVMARLDIAERRIAQDGRAGVRIGSRNIDLRVSTFPTSYGERAVLRLLDKSQQVFDLEALGMPESVRRPFLEVAQRSHGLVLVTGPTGSGKTTTLYATLTKIAQPKLNIMTIEDPIEYELSTVGLTISQSQINTKKGVSFASGLRHLLRQDPDCILVGEIRDSETARVAIQSSLTGHLVFSTLHTNDAPSAVTRLLDLGVEPFLLSASLTAVLAQRLVRTVHESCEGQGCRECFGSGFRGRVAIFEFLPVTESLRPLIAQGEGLGRLRQALREQGFVTLHEAGQALVEAGRTTAVEVERVVQGAET